MFPIISVAPHSLAADYKTTIGWKQRKAKAAMTGAALSQG
jgi:hypothetical protein